VLLSHTRLSNSGLSFSLSHTSGAVQRTAHAATPRTPTATPTRDANGDTLSSLADSSNARTHLQRLSRSAGTACTASGGGVPGQQQHQLLTAQVTRATLRAAPSAAGAARTPPHCHTSARARVTLVVRPPANLRSRTRRDTRMCPAGPASDHTYTPHWARRAAHPPTHTCCLPHPAGHVPFRICRWT